MRPALAVFAAAALWQAQAAAQPIGDPEAGRRLAEASCAGCHALGPGSPAPVREGVPSFAEVARMPSATPLSLQVFLRTPHDRMPDLHLSPAEMDDLIAYILSLRGR